MPLAQYKDLCIDATDPAPMAAFWAAAIGLDRDPDLAQRLLGPTPQDVVWINTVPEARTAPKNRMHIDLHTGSIEELVALGATVSQEFERWTIMTDPEGGEFCAFVREQVPERRIYELVQDAHDPAALGRWWAELLGGDLDADGVVGIGKIPYAPFEWLCFAPADAPKIVKNRVHIDVLTEDLDAIVAHGATLQRPRGGDIDWNVMTDPEGNEFCAFTPQRV